MRGSRVLFLPVVLTMVLLSGCAGGDAAGPAEYETFEGSVDRSYRSVAELSDEAGLIVRGEAISIESIRQQTVPYNLVTFEVSETLEGVAPSEPIVVRQLAGLMDGLAPPMDVGGEYLLFLRPFEFEPGVSTGQWYVVGPGQFLLKDGRYVAQVETKHLGSIPAVVPAVAVEKALGL